MNPRTIERQHCKPPKQTNARYSELNEWLILTRIRRIECTWARSRSACVEERQQLEEKKVTTNQAISLSSHDSVSASSSSFFYFLVMFFFNTLAHLFVQSVSYLASTQSHRYSCEVRLKSELLCVCFFSFIFRLKFLVQVMVFAAFSTYSDFFLAKNA